MYESNISSNDPYLEIAIQTVLYRYKNQLQDSSSYDDENLFKEIAAEIKARTSQFKNITDLTLKQLEENDGF
jgi:hypothetical protein